MLMMIKPASLLIRLLLVPNLIWHHKLANIMPDFSTHYYSVWHLPYVRFKILASATCSLYFSYNIFQLTFGVHTGVQTVTKISFPFTDEAEQMVTKFSRGNLHYVQLVSSTHTLLVMAQCPSVCIVCHWHPIPRCAIGCLVLNRWVRVPACVLFSWIIRSG